MIVLYQRTDCPFCWKVRLALAELELAYSTVDLELGGTHPDVARHSPTGTVPVLVDGGTAIWESSVILDYLDARYAPWRLFPGQPIDAARVRLLQTWSDKVVGRCLKGLVFEKRARVDSDRDQDVICNSERQWRDCMDWLEGQLNDRNRFSDDYTAADCALAARFGVAAAYGAGVTPDHPGLHEWFSFVSHRPSWQAAYPTSFIRPRQRSSQPQSEHYGT